MVYSSYDLTELLKKAGLRVTSHRMLVLQTLAKAKEPLTVYELFDILRKKEAIDQATVYRNLHSLHEAGVLRRMDFNHGHAHYELSQGKPGHKIVCSKCEAVEKIEGVALDGAMQKMLQKSKKFKNVKMYSTEVYSVCKSCA